MCRAAFLDPVVICVSANDANENRSGAWGRLAAITSTMSLHLTTAPIKLTEIRDNRSGTIARITRSK